MARNRKQLALDFGNLSPEDKSYVAATVAIKRRRKKGVWRGMPAVPPGSLLEEILQEFQSNTNIPLEIPFTTFLHYVAAVLIGKNVSINFCGKIIGCDFWTVVLALSGAGKTWTEKEISAGLKDENIPLLNSSAVSAAAFLGELESNPRSLWIRDEYLQLLKNIENPNSPLSDLKDILLRVYDNSKVERKTKRDTITVEDPCLSILGFNALTTFTESMSAESLVDGFAQRFAYVVARPDPNRHFSDYGLWIVDKTGWKSRFNEIFTNLHNEYIANEDAEKAFLKMFKRLLGGVNLEESFYRRVMWRAHKYALIYHVVRGAASHKELTEEDYGWASRLIEMQLNDAAEVIEMSSGNDLSKAIEAADSIVKKLNEQAKPVTARALVQGSRLINNVSIARFILQILGVAER